ncbi:putative flagellar biosynthesis protein FliR [Pillotina sp. SPG140]|jgi:flagellar biosynthetic protein FliR
MLNEILRAAPAFLLVAVRALAMIETSPLLSSDAVPQVAKVALAGLTAYATFTFVSDWNMSAFGLEFVFFVIGEALIGIIIGFFITIVFASFSTAGQFFSLQMGFGASETFDPLTQVENPLIGQFLNLVALLVFLTMDGFQTLFLRGFWRSVQSLSVIQLINGRESVVTLLLHGLSRLFLDALIISLPILGTLFLISLATGLISKAAPQINILSEGFPISIIVAFIMILVTMPFMVESFSHVLTAGFQSIEDILRTIGTQIEQ